MLLEKINTPEDIKNFSQKQIDELAKELIDDWIDYYNNDRIKLRLNGMSPVQYRETYLASLNV